MDFNCICHKPFELMPEIWTASLQSESKYPSIFLTWLIAKRYVGKQVLKRKCRGCRGMQIPRGQRFDKGSTIMWSPFGRKYNSNCNVLRCKAISIFECTIHKTQQVIKKAGNFEKKEETENAKNIQQITQLLKKSKWVTTGRQECEGEGTIRSGMKY